MQRLALQFQWDQRQPKYHLPKFRLSVIPLIWAIYMDLPPMVMFPPRENALTASSELSTMTTSVKSRDESCQQESTTAESDAGCDRRSDSAWSTSFWWTGTLTCSDLQSPSDTSRGNTAWCTPTAIRQPGYHKT